MKIHLMMAALAAVALPCMALSSCATGAGGSFPLPVAIGFQIPDTDAVLTLRPDPDSPRGFALEMTGNLEGIEQTADGWQFVDAENGVTYRIRTTGPGAPLLEVIGTTQVGPIIVNPPRPPPVVVVVEPEK